MQATLTQDGNVYHLQVRSTANFGRLLLFVPQLVVGLRFVKLVTPIAAKIVKIESHKVGNYKIVPKLSKLAA